MRLFWKSYSFRSSYKNAGAFYSICLTGSYEPLLSRLKESDVVLDGGANIGVFSILASRRVRKVYAIEPNPFNFDLLVKNIHDNHVSNIIPINAALSDKVGTVHFEGEGEIGHLSAKGATVPSVTIDSVSQGEVSAIKLDIEGAEPLALIGQETTLSANSIAFELDINQFTNMLNSLGTYDRRLNYPQLLKYLRDNNYDIIYPPGKIDKVWSLAFSKDAAIAELKTGFLGLRSYLKGLVETLPDRDYFHLIFAFKREVNAPTNEGILELKEI